MYNKLDTIVQITVIVTQSATNDKIEKKSQILNSISLQILFGSVSLSSKTLVSPEFLAACLHSADTGFSHRARTPTYLPCWLLGLPTAACLL